MNIITKLWQPRSFGSIKLFPRNQWCTAGAYQWDSLIEFYKEWNDLEYMWMAESNYGDQVIWTPSTPIHRSGGIYICGMDIAGPKGNPKWPACVLYYGKSIDDWLARIEKYGDEWSIGPGAISKQCPNPQTYLKTYRKLNPGITW